MYEKNRLCMSLSNLPLWPNITKIPNKKQINKSPSKMSPAILLIQIWSYFNLLSSPQSFIHRPLSFLFHSHSLFHFISFHFFLLTSLSSFCCTQNLQGVSDIPRPHPLTQVLSPKLASLSSDSMYYIQTA